MIIASNFSLEETLKFSDVSNDVLEKIFEYMEEKETNERLMRMEIHELNKQITRLEDEVGELEDEVYDLKSIGSQLTNV